MRNLLIGWLVALAIVVTSAPANAQTIDGIQFLDAGIFAGRVLGKQPSPRTASGTINISGDRDIIEQTDRICARLGVFFGVKYQLTGKPAGETVMLDLVTRFPEPGMVNAKGERFLQNEFNSLSTIGTAEIRTFSFDEKWELVPGLWVFEFHFKGRKIGETAFHVMTTCETS